MPERSANKPRDVTLDVLKGFTILCVVLGHALNRGLQNPNDNILFLLLTAFEMPLFMFLSGYVLSGRVKSPRGAWLGQRALRLMTPFFVWQFIFAASTHFGTLAAQDGGALEFLRLTGSSVSRVFITPVLGLWYLPALLICSALLVLFYRISHKPLVFFLAPWLLLMAINAGLNALPITVDFGIQKATTFWLFFAGGYLWAASGFRFQADPKKAFKLLPALAASLYPAIAIIATQNADLFSAMPGTLKRVLGFAGIASAVVLVRAIEPFLLKLRFDVLGTMTLGIYCVHWLFLRSDFGTGALSVLILFAWTLTGSIVASLIMQKSPILRAVLLGGWKKRPQQKQKI